MLILIVLAYANFVKSEFPFNPPPLDNGNALNIPDLNNPRFNAQFGPPIRPFPQFNPAQQRPGGLGFFNGPAGLNGENDFGRFPNRLIGDQQTFGRPPLDWRNPGPGQGPIFLNGEPQQGFNQPFSQQFPPQQPPQFNLPQPFFPNNFNQRPPCFPPFCNPSSIPGGFPQNPQTPTFPNRGPAGFPPDLQSGFQPPFQVDPFNRFGSRNGFNSPVNALNPSGNPFPQIQPEPNEREPLDQSAGWQRGNDHQRQLSNRWLDLNQPRQFQEQQKQAQDKQAQKTNDQPPFVAG